MSSFQFKRRKSNRFSNGLWIFSLLLLTSAIPVSSQIRSRRISGGAAATVKTERKKVSSKTPLKAKIKRNGGDETVGVPTFGEAGIQRTTEEIMNSRNYAPASSRPKLVPEREIEGSEEKTQNPNSPLTASSGDVKSGRKLGSQVRSFDSSSPLAPQTVGTSFTGATLADTRAFPPDTMGAVGPAQFVVFVNGRLRTFDKTTGTADGVLNVDPDVFFSSVETPVGGTVVLDFTSDPNVRYDRLSGRWFLTIIDVPCTNATCSATAANRILVAVSDAASAGVLSSSTIWTYYYVQQDTVGGVPSTGEFLDYPSLGIDNNALYIGGNMFSAAGAFAGTNGYVINKNSVLGGGPILTTAFRGLAVGNTGEGPFAPRGVDNYDPAATEGYFVGTSNAAFGRLVIRRISTPGGTPTISANILITVPATGAPRTVDHLGNTGGTSGRLDALDDRLYAAHIRNGRLWTAHNISVLATGVGTTTGGTRRDAVRWYELSVPTGTGTPTVNQSGTIFDSAATTAAARQYWIPSVMVSGQGHATLAYSTAGTPYAADAATSGRLVGDALGTTQAVNIYTASSTAYNPPSDPGGSSGRRWGDYSLVSLDPKDDMTMWTIQEFCSETNVYGARAVKLIAPPPASIADGPNAGLYNVPVNVASFNVTITGTQVSGSGFYDPGANLAAPALPFNHIAAAVSGGIVVNSITYNSPISVTLNLSTYGVTAPSAQNLTITNPDGQTVSRTGIINITAPTAASAAISGRAVTAKGQAINHVQITVRNSVTQETRTVFTNQFGYFTISNLSAGSSYLVTAQHKQYQFDSGSQLVNLNQDTSLKFVAH